MTKRALLENHCFNPDGGRRLPVSLRPTSSSQLYTENMSRTREKGKKDRNEKVFKRLYSLRNKKKPPAYPLKGNVNTGARKSIDVKAGTVWSAVGRFDSRLHYHLSTSFRRCLPRRNNSTRPSTQTHLNACSRKPKSTSEKTAHWLES